MKTRRKFVGCTSVFWDADRNESIHSTFKLTFDHNVDKSALQAALDLVYYVWPVLKSRLVKEDSEFFLEECNIPAKVYESKEVIAISGLDNDVYPFVVSFYGDTVFMSASHSLFDGGGMLMIIRLLAMFYWDIYTGNPAKAEQSARDFKGDGENLDRDVFAEVTGSYHDMPLIGLPDKSCSVEEFVSDADDRISYGEVQADSSEFIALCKKNHIKPMPFMFLLAAKAVYRMKPDEELPIVGLITQTNNVRKMMNVEKDPFTCGLISYVSVDKKELNERPASEISQKIQEMLSGQLTKERIYNFMTAPEKFGRPVTVMPIYFGKLDFGEVTSHIQDIVTVNYATLELIVFDLNGKMHFCPMMGRGTGAFMEAFSQALKDEGISSAVTTKKPYFLPKDTLMTNEMR